MNVNAAGPHRRHEEHDAEGNARSDQQDAADPHQLCHHILPGPKRFARSETLCINSAGTVNFPSTGALVQLLSVDHDPGCRTGQLPALKACPDLPGDVAVKGGVQAVRLGGHHGLS